MRRLAARTLSFDYEQALARVRAVEAEWQALRKQAEEAFDRELKEIEVAITANQ